MCRKWYRNQSIDGVAFKGRFGHFCWFRAQIHSECYSHAITPSIFEQCYFFISAQDFALPSAIKSENRPCRGSSKIILCLLNLIIYHFKYYCACYSYFTNKQWCQSEGLPIIYHDSAVYGSERIFVMSYPISKTFLSTTYPNILIHFSN